MKDENTAASRTGSTECSMTAEDVGSRKSKATYFREDIQRAKGYVPGFQPKQADVVKLNANENPYPPSPAVMRALAELTPEQLRRYPDAKGDAFREAAAEVNGVEPDNIVCCKGGDDLLSLALRAFCDESRPVAYPVPTYSLYRVLAGFQNCQALEIPFDEDFNLPAELAQTGAALTIVCNPNAPSTTRVPVEDLASLAEKLSGILLIDEAYVDFAEGDSVALVKEYDNIIILRSLSKGYSLAGLRFGYAIADKDLIGGLAKIKDSYSVDAIAIALATAAIKDQAHFMANIEKVTRQRQLVTEQLRALDFKVPDSYTNFILAQPPTGSAAELCEQLTLRGIYVRYFDAPGLKDKLRISIGTAGQNEKLLAALREILSS